MRSIFHKRKLLVVAAAALHAANTYAVEVGQFDFSLSGFGTLGVLHSDYNRADFLTSALLYPAGVGYSRAWGTDQDSNLGVQLTATFGSRLTAVVQVVSELRYDNTFTPQLQWANLKYDFTPEWSLRVGRVVLPTFLTSETQKVGYVNPWVRTPAEVLVQLPVTNSDGADVSYRVHVGDVSNQLQFLYGSNRSDIPGDFLDKNIGIKTVSDTLEYGPATVHVSYQKMQYSIELASVAHPERYAFSCFDLGALYDPGRWYVTGELFNTYDEFIGHTQAWYLGGGYRAGKITLYAALSRMEQTSAGTLEQTPLFDQQTTMVGLRWDFMRNLDAKLQLDRVRLGSILIPTSFVNLQPGAKVGDTAHVLSATLDFVW